MPVACALVGFIISERDTDEIIRHVEDQLKAMQILARIVQKDDCILDDFTFDEIQAAFRAKLSIASDPTTLTDYDWHEPFAEHDWTDYVSDGIKQQFRQNFGCPAGRIIRISDRFISSEDPDLRAGQLLFGVGACSLLENLRDIGQLQHNCQLKIVECRTYLWIIEGE